MTRSQQEPASRDAETQIAPHPGSRKMPRWNVADLIDAPIFDRRKWFAMLGPGLLMGGSAIGGGEWLMGPTVTARYGGALMWLGTLSILGQVVYNIEISRYTLYTGEPIFTGKFRTLPGPLFWLCMYLVLDFGAVFPYLAANAATPAVALWLGQVPDGNNPAHKELLQYFAYGIFFLALIPLVFGGKIYNSLKAIMTFKIFVVLGFLSVLGLFYTSPATWKEIFTGFVRFGTVPVQQPEDRNGNGILDAGEEDWDSDGHADVIEPDFKLAVDADGDKKLDAFDLNGDKQADTFVRIGDGPRGTARWWPDYDGDGQADPTIRIDADRDGTPELELSLPSESDAKQVSIALIHTKGEKLPDYAFVDFDGDGTRDGDAVENVFASVARGDGLPKVDLSMIAFLAAFAAIAGSGGLSNAPISNYTRDQGWGMGHHVGAIPSAVGGHQIQLSHVGSVFIVTPESLPRWKRWYRHVVRDQLFVWMPACFLGIALPSLLSVQFLKRGTMADQWTAAGMTSDGVYERVTSLSGPTMGSIFWFMTLFCGFLVLAPSMASSIDGFVRRWVDVFWTASPTLREWDPRRIRWLYFIVLCAYAVVGLVLLSIGKPLQLVKISTNIMNFALGFSCWHAIFVTRVLLPREIRPSWIITLLLFLAGLFFWVIATVSALKELGWI